MSAEENNERAYARMARTSWGYTLRGARALAEDARAWTRAEGIEAHIKERDARALSAQHQRAMRAHARMSKNRRAHSAPPARANALTDIEVSTRAFGTRALRCALTLAVPASALIVPPWMLIEGNPGALLAWPAAYGYLAWLGWTHRDDDEPVRSVTTLAPVEEKTRLFSRKHAEAGLKPNGQESAIIDRVHTWEANAADRKLHEVFPGAPVIDESGILIPMEFAGLWTPAKLDTQVDQLRALLAVPDEVKTQVKPGGTADRAVLRIRTRVRDLDLTWSPERKGLGLNADTGEVVSVDVTDRLSVAGMSGAGKSVALRVLMAEALALPNTMIVIIDLKVEGALWSHVARVESEADGIQSVIDDLVTEMKEREAIMRTESLDTWEPTPERPRIVVVVDEGAELMSEVPDAVTGLRSIARRARSAEIPLWWATQKPTVTGPGKGLDSAISAQLTSQVCMAVSSPTEARNVLGEDATAKGWHAEDLLKGGWSLVRVQGEDRTPDPTRVWHMTKEHVKALEPRPPWRRAKTLAPVVAAKDALVVALELSEGLQGVSTARLAIALGVADTEVHVRMRVHDVEVEPNAFAMGNGEKARGYRRDKLEAAFNRRNDR
jgi:S-DNA-T family DNA segregation ATPase FtsK/SpoIIIE